MRTRPFHTFADAAWLPPGGRAEVWLAQTADATPSPICIARLLLIDADGRILVVDRPDGRTDIPSEQVGHGTAAQAIERLLAQAGEPSLSPGILGYVRNVVETATTDYHWPVPIAHFVVWTAQVDRPATGRWLREDDAHTALSARHWWPLASHARATVASAPHVDELT
ncbi:MAG: hypothetical protein ACTHNS_13775 [Marmoricola sp.]